MITGQPEFLEQAESGGRGLMDITSKRKCISATAFPAGNSREI